MKSKPKTIDEYVDWFKQDFNIDLRHKQTETAYKINSSNALTTIQESNFFKQLPSKLEEYAKSYETQHSADLLMAVPSLKLDQKPYASLIDKTFRYNVLWNKNWPKEPKLGWLTPESWYEKINDLIRTTVVCKFIDGPGFLAENIKLFAQSMSIEAESRPQGRDEGYYAYHFYAYFDVDLFMPNGATKSSRVRLEIQVTTQLQDILRKLTHKHYAEDRVRQETDAWRWEYSSNKFKSRFLSHTLHLLEALIVELRDENKTPEESSR